MSHGQRVLLVNGLSETEEVLKAVLEPRGHRIDRLRGHAAPHASNGCEQPQVVVIDMDELPAATSSTTNWPGTPRVIIGSAHIHAPDGDSRYLEKPFQYRELVQAVEQFLARRTPKPALAADC